MSYWGRAGAGIVFLCEDRILLILRSGEVSEPWTWGISGGKLERGETPYKGALRETREEIGRRVPPHLVFDEVVFRDGRFQYTNFLARVTAADASRWRFELLGDEVDEVGWFRVDELPGDLHFGVRFLVESRPDLFRSEPEEP